MLICRRVYKLEPSRPFKPLFVDTVIVKLLWFGILDHSSFFKKSKATKRIPVFRFVGWAKPRLGFSIWPLPINLRARTHSQKLLENFQSISAPHYWHINTFKSIRPVIHRLSGLYCHWYVDYTTDRFELPDKKSWSGNVGHIRTSEVLCHSSSIGIDIKAAIFFRSSMVFIHPVADGHNNHDSTWNALQ